MYLKRLAFFLFSIFFAVGLSTIPGVVNAAAKKPVTGSPGTPGSCSLANGTVVSTPFPVRKVVLQPVGTTVFPMPNGKSADMSMDLNAILNTVVAESTTLSPTVSTATLGPCDDHIELRAAVSTFQLNMVEAGVTVGYSPSGPISTIASIKGSVDSKIGTIGMEFSIWDCRNGICTSPVAATASHLTAGVNLALKIDFSVVNTGSSLVYNTPLGGILRQIMKKGIDQISNSPRLNELSWTANVQDVVATAGSLTIDVGSSDRVAPNQQFEVYEISNSTTPQGCPKLDLVGLIHTSIVGTIQSFALIDTLYSTKSVQSGNVITIHPVGN